MTDPVRLSESPMWHDLRDFYESEGVAAWSNDQIPFFATNNPALAKTYTDLLLAWIEDLLVAGMIDADQPVTVVELGGGMGRLAYLILCRLSELRSYFPVEVTYLLTDYSSSNVDYYRGHEKLLPFLEEGTLAVQCYDAESEQSLELRTDNPIFVIGNYLFDSLSHDGFRVKDGILYEARCRRTEEGEVELGFVRAPDRPYGQAEYDAVLEEYRSTLGDTHFPFPIGPLRCLEGLARQSHGRLAFLMADKALRSLEELLGFESLPVQKHRQGFSMSVNCHAIDQIWRRRNGVVHHSAVRSHPLNIALYSRGLEKGALRRTERVFKEQIDGFGPLDYLDFRKQVLALSKTTLPLCLQLLRLSRWDAELFYELSNVVGEKALHAPLNEQRELYDVMAKCWENFFPIGDERDVPFAVARTLACINQFEQAIGFYGESLRLYGDRPLTHHNIGICHFNLGRLEEAHQSFARALTLDPNYGPSKELRIRLQAEEERRQKLVP